MVIKGFGSVYMKRHKHKDGSWFESPALWISFKYHGRWHAESSATNNLEEAVERLKARVNELSSGRKTVKEDKIRYEDLVKQLKLDNRAAIIPAAQAAAADRACSDTVPSGDDTGRAVPRGLRDLRSDADVSERDCPGVHLQSDESRVG